MKTKLNLGLVFLFVFLLSNASKAQFRPEIFSQKKSGETVKQRLTGGFPKNIDTVTDDKFSSMSSSGAWRTSFKHKSVFNRITLSIKDTTKAVQKFDYLFYFTVDTFDMLNRRGSFNMVMRLSYNPTSHKAYTDKSVFQFAKCHRYIIKLTSIVDSSLSTPAVVTISTMKTNFILESEIIVERYYLGAYSTPVSGLNHTYIGKDKLRISWSPPSTSAPNKYELEWAYIDTSGIKYDSLKYDFIHNSSRVAVTKTYYVLNTVYDAGAIIYRVRRVKPDSVYFKFDKYSSWYPSNSPKGYLKNYSSGNRLYIQSHENMGKNWDYQVAFAEEGLKKEVINYFDGSLKRRQGVTLLNTNNFALVDESIYDKHGREAIKIIPAPSDSNTIRYYPNFNQNVAGKHYSASDFDTSNTMADKCNGNYTAKPLGNQSGAGRYYSTNNPDKTNENAAIPDAQGYAMVQTQLMPDPTGRVYSQGGVGKTHQLGSGHETKYTYGTANQEELDQLFGSEMGIASHYKKNAVIDPNGQISISYIDQHGRVVATALSGGVPGSTDTLSNFLKTKYTAIDINYNNVLQSNALKTRYDFNVLQSGTHKIYYKLETPDFKFGCVGLNSCYTCRYDIQVSLFDGCGGKLMDFKRTIGRLNDTSCNPFSFNLKDSVSSILGATGSGDSIAFYLNQGTYHLEKTLTVNTDSLDSKINQILLNDSTCFKTFNSVLEDELDDIDYSDCGCETCTVDSMTYCESRKQLMLNDVIRDGQYFTYNEPDYSVTNPTSILRTVSGFPYYHTINAANFLDENGVKDTVWFEDGTFKMPNDLTVEEFVTRYNPSWSNSLLVLHPEYCYYQFCMDSLSKSTTYDEAMMEIDDYDTALYYGYLDPLNYRADYTSNPDPYFVKTDGTLKLIGSEFKKKLEDISDYAIGSNKDPLSLKTVNSTNLWQFAMAIGFCENVSDSFERQSCFKYYYSDSVKNNWMNDVKGRDNYWAKFKSLYYQYKQKFIEGRMTAAVSGTNCVKNIGYNSCSDANYVNKISHFIRYENNNPLANTQVAIDAKKNALLDSLKNLNTCNLDIANWDNALKRCVNYVNYRDTILYHLVKVCEAGSLNPKAPNIMGSMDVPEVMSKGLDFTSFEQVLSHFLGTNYKTTLCNIDLINSPRSATTDYNNEKMKEATPCICDKVKEEIKNFKGCNSRKDSTALSKEGLLVNDFMNALVKYDLINLNNHSRTLDSCPDMVNVANQLFVPVLGGAPNSLVIKEKVQSLYLNEKTFTVYVGSEATACRFAIRMLNNANTFSNINLSKKAVIKPISQGVFEYKFTYNTGATATAYVYTTCFNNLGKCSPYLSASDLSDFTSYFNTANNANLTSIEIEQLVAQCGNASFPNVITDKLNTYYLRYGSCPDYYRNYKEPKDIHLINTLNQMMRGPHFWKSTDPGYLPGDSVKRYLTTKEPQFHCNQSDFLTMAKDYHLYKALQGNLHDNYWWDSPRFTVTTSNIFGVNYYDTIWLNNYNKDPYFVGGFWIGTRCADIKDSTCFTSFGDPYKQLGKGSKPTISQIDSLNYMRWDYKLGSFVITAFKRSSPNDSVILTINSQCKVQCNPLFAQTEIAVSYKNVYIKPGAAGISKLSNVKATVGFRSEYVYPFMDMINGLAKAGLLVASPTVTTDIRQFKKSYKFPNYFDQLYPIANGYNYSKEYLANNDTILLCKLGTGAQYCKFGFRKTGVASGWSFANISVFKNLKADPQAINDALLNDQIDMANYHFTIQAGKINSPGDTTWYNLRGWSSCWKFSEVSVISGEGKALFNLPDEFAGNCNCLTCPESKKWSDSLYTEYPDLYPSHVNYSTIVTNYINRKLNTTLSFSEIQSVWDACDIGSKIYIKKTIADYRLAVKNTDCVGHADSTLRNVMNKTGLSFDIESIKTSDSTIYFLNFAGMTNDDILILYDTLSKYFNAPYCSKFKHHKNYRNNTDISVYNTTASIINVSAFNSWFNGVKSTLFGGGSITNTSSSGLGYRDAIDKPWPSGVSKWIADLNIQALDYKQKKQFVDTLMKYIKSDPNISVKINFYMPELIESNDMQLCLPPASGSGNVCYTCDTFKNRILDYQYEVAAKRKNPSAAMATDSIAKYLTTVLNRKLSVISGATNCVSCGNEALYICTEPTAKLDSIISLLNKVAQSKKLNSKNYALGSAYISILNAIKPTGAIINHPTYTLNGVKAGGWEITLKYNTMLSDLIVVSNLDVDTFHKFGKGIDLFKSPQIYPVNGASSRFTLLAVDSLYKYTRYGFYISGLEAATCCQMPNNMLCPQPYTREFEIEDEPCHQEEINNAYTRAVLLYSKYQDSIKHAVSLAYQTHCLSKSKENFIFTMFQQRYHVTLYYYDQAGNLTKTVPPQGVNELKFTVQKRDSILKYRNKITVVDSFVNTYHQLGTNYKYNSLNQLVWQKTPDGGQSRFWYDRLGRLMLSQNANQAARSNYSQKVYSYTKYDPLGRITEVGEVTNTGVDSVQLIQDLAYYNSWLNSSTARTQITKTYYDYGLFAKATAQFESGQQNLRGRVSSVLYFDYYASDSNKYTRATHYCYDIHGNVNHLVHDFPDMATIGEQFKHLTYVYDLISGKVINVSYQAGKADRWYHRYNYDADNRLNLAETSTDSVIWDKDAEYKYYKHGPLARTILGEHAVQGVDYAYTLHGWLKGVNSNTLEATRDIGKDGTGVLRKYTARDAYGFTLGYFTDNTGTGYFDGDYSSIGTTGFEASTAGSPLANSGANLYNGNITHMVTAVGVLMAGNGNSPVATAYRYDQLNRISLVRSYNGINISANSWNSGSLQSKWRERFKYDANGNITKLIRHTASGVMDSLTYNYKSGTNQLLSVDDIVGSSSFTADVDDQNTNNYKYDAIGNLIHDEAEEIDSIFWNVYGKIKAIKRKAGSTRPGLQFEYDAAGQRVLKIVKPTELQNSWIYTWYVRDAQGNVMATYTKKSIIKNGDSSLYRKINKSLVLNMNSDSLAALIKQYFSESQFQTTLAQSIIDKNMAATFQNQYVGDTLLKFNSNFGKSTIENFCTYYSSPTLQHKIDSIIWVNKKDSIIGKISTGCVSTLTSVSAILAKDGTSNFLLNALATRDMARFNNIYTQLGGPPVPPTTVAQKITYIRGFPDISVRGAILSPACFNTAAEMEIVISGLNSTLLFNAYVNSYDFCTLMGQIKDCVYDTTWYNFMQGNMPDSIISSVVRQSSDAFYLNSLLLSKDNKSINKIAALGQDMIADALREQSGLDISQYLMYIYKKFGKTMFNNIMEDMTDPILINRSLTLDELHIYGSSRHGIHKPSRQLLVKNYELKAISGDGQLALSGAAHDSTKYNIDYHYFKRTLSYKQYELSNHLGNVLATILDRKTAVTDNTGGDSLLYYSADVSTAGLYYAFGSAITDMQYVNDTNRNYRYGFNNQEKDNEIVGKGDYYAFEYRMHDARIGRFLSIDPLYKKYPYYSPYQFAGNTPIVGRDLEGLENPVKLNNNEQNKYNWNIPESNPISVNNENDNRTTYSTSSSFCKADEETNKSISMNLPKGAWEIENSIQAQGIKFDWAHINNVLWKTGNILPDLKDFGENCLTYGSSIGATSEAVVEWTHMGEGIWGIQYVSQITNFTIKGELVNENYLKNPYVEVNVITTVISFQASNDGTIINEILVHQTESTKSFNFSICSDNGIKSIFLSGVLNNGIYDFNKSILYNSMSDFNDGFWDYPKAVVQPIIDKTLNTKRALYAVKKLNDIWNLLEKKADPNAKKSPSRKVKEN